MTFKTITLNVKARLDRALAGIENHEAVAESALRDLHAALARATAQHHRLKRHGTVLTRQRAVAQEQIEVWTERARTTHDESRALQCVQRIRSLRGELEELKERLDEHERIERRLNQDLEQLTTRYRSLHDRHQVLRSREARAQVFQLAQGELTFPHENVDAVFERWETRLIEQEVVTLIEPDEWDELEHEFQTEEERRELKLELQKIRGEA